MKAIVVKLEEDVPQLVWEEVPDAEPEAHCGTHSRFRIAT